MKYVFIPFIFNLITSCQNSTIYKQSEPRKDTITTKHQTQDASLYTDTLFKITFTQNDSTILIKAPSHIHFELPDSTINLTANNITDFNADKNKDILINMGACGTGGCVYALFIYHHDDYYHLAYFDYLKNPEFNLEKNGFIKITSSEELEPNNPYNLLIKIFKYDEKSKNYELFNNYRQVECKGG